jgi:hypothetical protein
MWPFNRKLKETPAPSKRNPFFDRKSCYVTITQEVTDGRVTGAAAYLEGYSASRTMAAVPVDALGELVFAYPKRFGLEKTDPGALPKEEQMKNGQLYLTVEEIPGKGWQASLGGKGMVPQPCACNHDEVTWLRSKIWENKHRAVGMLVIVLHHYTSIHVLTNPNFPIRLRHPDEPAPRQGDSCCCCGGDCGL